MILLYLSVTPTVYAFTFLPLYRVYSRICMVIFLYYVFILCLCLCFPNNNFSVASSQVNFYYIENFIQKTDSMGFTEKKIHNKSYNTVK